MTALMKAVRALKRDGVDGGQLSNKTALAAIAEKIFDPASESTRVERLVVAAIDRGWERGSTYSDVLRLMFGIDSSVRSMPGCIRFRRAYERYGTSVVPRTFETGTTDRLLHELVLQIQAVESAWIKENADVKES